MSLFWKITKPSLCIALSSCFTFNTCLADNYPNYDTFYDDLICIDSGHIDTLHNRPNKECEEGTEDGDKLLLTANYYMPVATDTSDQKFPALIFINSWLANEKEYLVQARKFAKEGFIALSYGTRGFGESDGTVNTAGLKDISDLSAVIDWLQNNSNIPWDGKNIGVLGVSYGGGISLVGLGNDPRITAAASMSGWGSLLDSLWGGQTANVEWLTILIGSGSLLGRLDNEIHENHDNMRNYQNIEETINWAAERSALTYVNNINHHPERTNPPAVFISNNWSDNLFQANSVLELYAEIETKAILRINEGIHGTAEGSGIIGFNNPVWTEVHRFFHHYLRGVDNGIDTEPPVSFAVKNAHKRHYYDDWPIPADITLNKTFYLGPRPEVINIFDFQAGSLAEAENIMFGDTNDTISSVRDTNASLGFLPVVAALGESVDIAVLEVINRIDPNYSVTFQTAVFDEDIYIRGVAKFDAWVLPSANSSSMIAYLYDVEHNNSDDNPFGTGTLITHGPVTLHQVSGDPNADESGLTEPIKASIEFNGVAYDISAGHSLALVVDARDPEYHRINKGDYTIDIIYQEGKQNTLFLPTVMDTPIGLPVLEEENATENEEETAPENDTARSADSSNGSNKPSSSQKSGSIGILTLALLTLLGLRRRQVQAIVKRVHEPGSGNK